MKSSSIARNTSYFTLALILQKIFSFAYFTLLARNLVPEELGKYFLAISITSIFAIIIDLGMTNVVVREVAKKQYQPEKLLGNVLLLKIPLSLLALLAVFVMSRAMGYPEVTQILIYISAISMLLDSFTLTFYSIMRGFHNLKYESIGSVIFQAIVFIVGWTFLATEQSLYHLMAVMALASVFNFFYSLTLVKFKFKLRFFTGLDPALIKTIITITVPFAIFALLQRLYMYFDSVLLSALASDHEVGIYQISFKIIFALQFLPMAFVASLYPAFASHWKDTKKSPLERGGCAAAGVCETLVANIDDSDTVSVQETSNTPRPSGHPSREGNRSQGNLSQLAVTFERAMNYLIIISLPISVGVITLADRIIMILKPEYVDAVLPLQVIMISLPFIFLNFPLGSLLNACDRQAKNTHNMAIVVVVSVILNIILIPRLGALGASITVLVTNALMMLIGLYFIRGLTDYRLYKIGLVLAKVLISAIIMGLVVIWLKPILNMFLIIPLAATLYAGLLLLFRAVRKEDVTSILSSFLKKNA